jgi:hypothetical protein
MFFKEKSTFKASVLSLILISGILLSFIPPVSFLINYYVDDGFFYLKIANNFANGLGSNFDGINMTNGYHPLWFLILSFWFFLLSLITQNPSPEFLLRFSCLLHFLLLSLIIFFTYKAYKILFNVNWLYKLFLFAALSMVPLATRNFGMEVHIIPVLLSAYLWLKAKEFRFNESHTGFKILIFILIGLTRIENFFTVVPVLIGYEVLTGNRKHLLKNILIYSIPCFSAFLLYLFTNFIFFGHFFTISLTIKSSFPNIFLLENINVLRTHAMSEIFITSNLLFFIFSTVLIIIRLLWEKKNHSDTKLSLLLISLSIAYCMYLMLNLIFNKECIREWYLSGIVYISAAALSTIIQIGKNKIAALTIAITCFFLFYFYNGRIQSSRNLPEYEFAKDIQRYVAPDETVFQVDYSGFTGFFSERTIINGDGLVNSFEFYNYMKRNALPEYLSKYNIDYYITFSANIDSVEGKIYDDAYGQYFGQQMVFPVDKIKFCKTIVSESYLSQRNMKYYLIKF